MSKAEELYATNETFREVADLLYGDGLEIAKASPDGSDLNSGSKKNKTPKWQENVAYATNTAGAVAGPAAIYQAVKGRKGGGMPRDFARSGTLGGKAKRMAGKLDTPGSKKAKIAAGVAGGTMIGLQSANMAGDAIASRMISQKKKEDKKKVSKAGGHLVPLAKSEDEKVSVPTRRGQWVALAAKEGKEHGPAAAKKTGQVADKTVKVGGGKLKAVKVKVEEKVKKDDDEVVWEGEFSKFDTDKRQVFGWASVVQKDGQEVVDIQGDYISQDELERAAYDYVIKSRKGGNQHRRVDGGEPFHAADMIESFIVTDEKIEKMSLPEDTPRGWWVGFKVNDEETWQQIKSGERKGFSIHGRGKRS